MADYAEVSTPADTFANFVEILASALDEPETRGEELASRMHFSRYHFDRIVRAAAGETPARFRRRVLLERAAYRLQTSRDGVLQVALEAGYSSNESFTRAFTRAYGSPPAAWRSRRGVFQLPSPNRVHFYPPGGLRLPARSEVTSMDLIVRMVEHHIFVIGEMVERARRLTDAQLDAPIELSVEGVDDNPTVRSLLSRLVGQMDMWNCSMDNREYDFEVERNEPLELMTARFAGVSDDFLRRVREVCEEGRLDETFVDAVCDPPEVFTFGGMIAHVLTFAAHRRTLVAGALWTAGIQDVEYDPMRWVAAPGR